MRQQLEWDLKDNQTELDQNYLSKFDIGTIREGMV